MPVNRTSVLDVEIGRKDEMRSIELFTGAGGLALGTHRAGFHHLAVVERDHDSCDTLQLNRVRRRETGIDWIIHEADVSTFDYSPFPQPIDLLAGGAPCQPFSLGGKHAGDADRRNMFPAVFRAVRELRPRAFLLENVKGLLRSSFRPYFDYIVEQLAFPYVTPNEGEGWKEHKARLAAYHAAGERVGQHPWGQAPQCRYDVRFRLYNVADFGVPQERHRVFIVGFRHDLQANWCFPEPTHSEDALLHAQFVDGSYWDEHDLPWRPTPTDIRGRVTRLQRTPQPFERRWHTVRDAIKDLPEPVDFVPDALFANHVGIPDAKSYPGHTGSPWDWPSKAIKAGDHGNPGGENMLRRDDGSIRYFTVRELARLQTFPDEWHFANSWSESRRQLGNAVPVSMAELIAHRIHAELDRIDHPSLAQVRESALAMAT